MNGTEIEPGDAVLSERRGNVLVITLNRPDQMNSINAALANGLADAVRLLDEDTELAVGVLAGAGRGFCAGMDLKAFARGENIQPFGDFIINGSLKPLIAAVEGFALAGGLEMALSCDLIVAARGAKLGIPETKVGLFASGGGLARLASRASYSKALEMAMTGDPILSEEAADLGIVSRLAEKGGAVDAAIELAHRIAQNAPLGVAASKRLIRSSIGLTEAEFWELQRPIQAQVFTSHDAVEGPAAFAEKRSPKWTGT